MNSAYNFNFHNVQLLIKDIFSECTLNTIFDCIIKFIFWNLKQGPQLFIHNVVTVHNIFDRRFVFVYIIYIYLYCTSVVHRCT